MTDSSQHRPRERLLGALWRLWWGGSSVGRGLVFILRTPSLRLRAFLPIILLPVAVVLGVLLLFSGVESALAAFWSEAPRWIWVLAGIGGVGLGVGAGVVVTQGLSGAVTERVAHRQLEALGLDPLPDEPAWMAMRRSFGVTLLGLLVATLLWSLLLLIDLALPPLIILTTPIGLLATAFIIAWDIFDFPMEARHMSWRERSSWFYHHPAEMIGLGLALSALFVVPILDMLLLPVAVAAAARLLAEEAPPRRSSRLGSAKTD